ncbi:MAG: PaREP1/PaREP8 domain-containing protein, partial [Dehalococcoidia bacterium]|nr:PaREP1/PaREP8 domain-containing protein [Dehalococcoidia bacterium]
MTLRSEPIEAHYIHSQRLIQHAEEKLAEGDRLQASEKAWGAVAHYFKHIAAQRGWRYVTHA